MRKAQWTKIVMPMENVPARKMLSETSAIQLLKHSMTSLIQKVHIQIWQLSAQSKSWVATQGSSMSLGSLLYIFYCNWHELRKQEKCVTLALPRSKFYMIQWVWQGVKLTRLMLIFCLFHLLVQKIIWLRSNFLNRFNIFWIRTNIFDHAQIWKFIR